jgi:hypothetical protein
MRHCVAWRVADRIDNATSYRQTMARERFMDSLPDEE